MTTGLVLGKFAPLHKGHQLLIDAAQLETDRVIQYLDPVVYRDLITKVVFLGAPSTGKTTLARELAALHKTVWMPEFGREYWDKHQCERRLTKRQLVAIAEGHREREEAHFQDADRTIFIDTDATITLMFSLYYHGTAHPRLVELADETLARYDLFFLCDTDVPYDDTWDRSGDANRQVLQQRTKADLLERRIPFITLTGPLKKRKQKVTNVLRSFDRFRSLGDNLTASDSGSIWRMC